ncbi:hypothetical protein ZIOFF_032709 [Zingiber officinale]|uniref:Retroviral polymerase SH3-like domain-containing protein n=1 Tax=Zingiber officinale TaxID=94328 RepID=A0A8J5LB80_ZINOF|nr:hypothetical protein ZIOFF_032709 [Zingiber officinale]
MEYTNGDLLSSLDVWDLVETGYTIIETSNGNKQALKAMKKREKNALFTIYQGVNKTAFKLIILATTSQEAWEMLKTTYDGVDKVKKIHLQALQTQFETLQQEASFFRVISIVHRMRRNVNELKDARVVMVVEELMGSLQAYEQRILKKNQGRTLESALQAKLSFKKNESFTGDLQRGRAFTWRGEMVVLLTPIGTLKIRMMEMKIIKKDMEEVMVEAEVKVVDVIETKSQCRICKKGRLEFTQSKGGQEDKQTKLEDKSVSSRGYCENASGYKRYNSITQKLVISRYVEFDEEQA